MKKLLSTIAAFALASAAIAQQSYNFPTATKLGNVAAGTASTDAANVGQLPAATTFQGGTTGTPVSGAVRLLPGANVTVTQSGQDITVAATGGGGGVSLTTTGTDGAATLSGAALNIPTYLRAQNSSSLAAGVNAGNATFTGNYDVMFGPYSFNNLTASSYNTGIGNAAGEQTTIGSYNTAVGALSLTRNVTGGKNACLAYDCLSQNTSASNVVSIGGWNGDNQSNRVVLSDGDGTVTMYAKTPISGGNQAAYTLFNGRLFQQAGGSVEIPGSLSYQLPTTAPTLNLDGDAMWWMNTTTPTLRRRAAGVTTDYPIGGGGSGYVQSQYANYPSGLKIGNLGSTMTLGADNADVLVIGDSSTNESSTTTNLTVLGVQGSVGMVIDGGNVARLWKYSTNTTTKWVTTAGDVSTWTSGTPTSGLESFSLRQHGTRTASSVYQGTAWTFTVYESVAAANYSITISQGSLFWANGQALDGNSPVEFAISIDGTKAILLLNGTTAHPVPEVSIWNVTYSGGLMLWVQQGTNIALPSSINLQPNDVAIGNDGTPYYLDNTGNFFNIVNGQAVMLVSKMIGGGSGTSTLTSTAQGGTYRIAAFGPAADLSGGLAAIYVPSTGAVTRFAPYQPVNVNVGVSFDPSGNLWALGYYNNAASVVMAKFTLAIEAKFVKPLQLAGGFAGADGSQPATGSVVVTKGANAAVDSAAPDNTLGSVLVNSPSAGTQFLPSSGQGAVLFSRGTTIPGWSSLPPSSAAVYIGSSAGSPQWAAAGATGTVLTSTGTNSPPTFQSLASATSIVRVTETSGAAGNALFTNGTRGGSVTVVQNGAGITAPTNNGQAAWTLPAGNFMVTVNANYTGTSAGTQTIITWFGTSNSTPSTGALNALHGSVSKTQTGTDDMGHTIRAYVSLTVSTTYYLTRFAGTATTSLAAQIPSTGSFTVVVEKL